MDESDIEDDPHFAFVDEFEEEMDNFWLDEKPSREDEIDEFLEDDEEEEEEDYEVYMDEDEMDGLEDLLNAEEQEEIDQIMQDEEDQALLAEEVALLQAMQEEKVPEKLLLDSTNVDKLINMVSRVRLAWPEDLPGYNATEYATDPERSKFPASFYQNTDKEKTVMWHAENFRRQFLAQFPRRRALVIAPRNECGTQKLFPTYINPCVLGYPEFLEALTCAEFFKEFFAPELMEYPTRVPYRTQSHVTVLKNRKVNCFEYAVILASFLIGAGYDAYVVDGYASKAVCTMDATEDYVEPPENSVVDNNKGSTALVAPKPNAESTDDGKMDILSGIFGRQEEEEEIVVPPVSPSKYRFKRAIQVISQVGDLEEGDFEESSSFPDNYDLQVEQEQEERDPTDSDELLVPENSDIQVEELVEEEGEQSLEIEESSSSAEKSKKSDSQEDELESEEQEEEEEQSSKTVVSLSPENSGDIQIEEIEGEDQPLVIEEESFHETSSNVEGNNLLSDPAAEENASDEGVVMDSEEEEEEGDENEEEEETRERKKRKRPSCPEKYYATRTHAWILVKAGKRDVSTSFFIEPFSATKMSLEDETFFGVETVFNHTNFWVNLEDPMEFYAGEISYDLNDSTKWAKLLVEAEQKRKLKDEDKSLMKDEEDDFPKKAELLLDMPVSFTPDPDIPQEDYDRKYPGGKKTFNYNNAIVELAAAYVNDDGLVRKVLKFKGTGRDPDDLEYIEEKFENRKDKLARRKWFREGRILHEYFNRGRKDALKEHVHISGKNKANYPRNLYYYANAHAQCVAHRQILKKGMVEMFEGRDDFLYYRFTSYGGVLCDSVGKKRSSEVADVEEQIASKSKAKKFMELFKGSNSGAKRVRRKIIKIIEKYHRDESKEVSEDVAEKHMLIDEGRLRVLFFYGDGNLTRHSLDFSKPKGSNPDTADFHPEDCVEYIPDPHSPPTDVFRRFLLLQRMETDQRVARVLAAQAEEEVFETVTSRVQEDFLHEIEPDAFAGEKNEEYMKMKEQTVVDDEEDEEEDFTNVDFTSPFFEKFGVPRSRMEEVLMKKRIMLNAKIRLVKKAQAIRKSYDRVASNLTEKMRWHDLHHEKLSHTQEEDFTRMYKERLFEMHIMETRLARHQQLASQSYYKTLLNVLKHPQLNKFKKKIPPPVVPVQEMSEEEKARLAALAAKLKDCCQFYTIKYAEPKKPNERKKNNAHQRPINEGGDNVDGGEEKPDEEKAILEILAEEAGIPIPIP